MIENFMVDNFTIKEFMVEKFGVKKIQGWSLGLKSSGLKCPATLLKNVNHVVQRVVFLHEDLMKLPSFPRKALEAELDLYVNGEMGKVSLSKDTRILGWTTSPTLFQSNLNALVRHIVLLAVPMHGGCWLLPLF